MGSWYYYRSVKDQNALDAVSSLFRELQGDRFVSVDYEVPREHMTQLHNNLNTSDSWANDVDAWETVATYVLETDTVAASRVVLEDRDRGASTRLHRDTTLGTVMARATHPDGRQVPMCIHTIKRDDASDYAILPVSYQWIEIKSQRRYEYVSDRASWTFTLIVQWSGEDRELAEKSAPVYVVRICSNDAAKARQNTRHTAASLLEKVMDTIYVNAPRSMRRIDLCTG